MKIKNLIVPILLFGLILIPISSPCTAAQKKKKETQEEKVVFIPKEVKTVFKEGHQTWQARMDIPFTIIDHLYLPSRQYLHSIFLFKVKNEDLGFLPVTPAQEGSPSILRSNYHVFLQFNRLENDAPGELIQEVYVPVRLELESASYEPEKEDLYSVAYALPPGNYLLSMAITSSQLEKIGSQYYKFSLPDATSFSDRLETTPLFLVKSLERMASPETRVEIHQGFFTWSVIKIEPNIDNLVSKGENLDTIFYIFGATPSEEGKVNIEIDYEVLKGEERVIRFANATYDFPLISQPLPLKRTVITKSEEGEEKKETQDLEPGKYSLSITITDKVSGKGINKSIDFELKE